MLVVRLVGHANGVAVTMAEVSPAPTLKLLKQVRKVYGWQIRLL